MAIFLLCFQPALVILVTLVPDGESLEHFGTVF